MIPTSLQPLMALLPEAMRDLMAQFLSQRDINSRVQIKFRMKALLDYAAADTEYPVNPLTAPQQPPVIVPPMAMPPAMQAGVAMPYTTFPAAAPAPAELQLQTSDILS